MEAAKALLLGQYGQVNSVQKRKNAALTDSTKMRSKLCTFEP